MSSGSPKRPSGVPAKSFLPSSPVKLPLVPGVFVWPGRMELTRIPRPPISRARANVRVSTAPLVAAYTLEAKYGSVLRIELILMMLPQEPNSFDASRMASRYPSTFRLNCL